MEDGDGGCGGGTLGIERCGLDDDVGADVCDGGGGGGGDNSGAWDKERSDGV